MRTVTRPLRPHSMWIGIGSPATLLPSFDRRPAGTPHDRDLSDLVGELSTQSELFRTRWAAHNVRYHDTGDKRPASPRRR